MTSFLKLTRPLHLLLVALTYILGASIPAYLGKPFQPLAFALGLAGVLLAQLSMSLLAEVFRPHNEPLVEDETPKQKETLRNNALYVSIAALASIALSLLFFTPIKPLHFPLFIFLLFSFILVLAYAIPPVRLLDRGFGELALAAHIAYVIPSIGFLLQAKGKSSPADRHHHSTDRACPGVFFDCQLHLFSRRPEISTCHTPAPPHLGTRRATASQPDCLCLRSFLPLPCCSVFPSSGPPSSPFPLHFSKSSSCGTFPLAASPTGLCSPPPPSLFLD